VSIAVAAQQGLEADTSQLAVPGSGSLLASIIPGLALPVSGWLAQLKPDPLGGERYAQAYRCQQKDLDPT